MPSVPGRRNPRLRFAYVFGVIAVGLSVEATALASVVREAPPTDFLWLAALTALGGLLPIRLPKTSADISISETFVFSGTILFGPAHGVLLGMLDVALVWARVGLRRELWQRVVFSLAAGPLWIWLSGRVFFLVTDSVPLYFLPLTPPDVWMVVGLALFATLYFLLNSFSVAVAIALDESVPVLSVWSNFTRLWLNYWAGASLAALLVSVTRTISPLWLLVVTPLMLVLFFTHRWAVDRVQEAEAHLHEMKKTFLQAIEALALAIDAKDQVTHGHIRRVQRHTMAVAEALGIVNENQLDALRAAALLHDTGKLAVPEYILNKPGPLTAPEFEKMKVHAAVGADILKNIDFPYPVEPIVRHHHEAWDGSGYPDGLKGADIPLGARILAVVDCYDALTSDRPYRPRMARRQAEQILIERRGRHYDPWVVDQFLRILDHLEHADAAEGDRSSQVALSEGGREAEYEVISAANAEDREFNELRRELARVRDVLEAAGVVFRYLRRMLPAASVVFLRPRTDSDELEVVAASGVGTAVMADLRVPVGERISGWVFAHGQTAFNSDATLELGPVAKTFTVPLRYAAGVPVVDRRPIGVLVAFASEPFEKDHERVMESIATVFGVSLAIPAPRELRSGDVRPPSEAGTRVH